MIRSAGTSISRLGYLGSVRGPPDERWSRVLESHQVLLSDAVPSTVRSSRPLWGPHHSRSWPFKWCTRTTLLGEALTACYQPFDLDKKSMVTIEKQENLHRQFSLSSRRYIFRQIDTWDNSKTIFYFFINNGKNN